MKRLLSLVLVLLLCPAAHAQLGDDVTLDNIDAYFAKLKDNGEEMHYPRLSFDLLKTGHVGVLPYAFDTRTNPAHVTTQVLQVLDDKSLVLAVRIFGKPPEVRVPAVERFKPQPPPAESKRWLPVATIAVIAKGTNTADLVDDRFIRLLGPWKVTGTDTYTTSRGSKKLVHVIEPSQVRLPD